MGAHGQDRHIVFITGLQKARDRAAPPSCGSGTRKRAFRWGVTGFSVTCEVAPLMDTAPDAFVQETSPSGVRPGSPGNPG